MAQPGKGMAGLIAGLLIGTIAVGSAQVVLASGHHAKVIRACESRSTGVLRIGKHCTRYERRVTWDKRGPRGPVGVVKGYAVSRGAESSIGAGATSVVAKLTVPATSSGRYLVNVSTSLKNRASDADSGHCAVAVDGKGTSQSFALATGEQTTSVTLSTIVTVTSAHRTIALSCGGSASTGVAGATMTALPLAG